MCTEACRESLIGFVYSELPPDEARAFEAHLAVCGVCREEVSGLRAVRDDLLAWAPPECRELPSSWADAPRVAPPMERVRAWAPAFGLAAAAMLVLGVSAAIANLEIRYDAQGLVIRTGRTAAEPARLATAPAATVVTAQDLAALEGRLRLTFAEPGTQPALQTVGFSSSNPQLTRDMRRLIEETEQRVRQEMTVRLTDLYNEWNATRQADMLRVQQVVNGVQSRTDAEMAQTRDAVSRLMLASQGQPQK